MNTEPFCLLLSQGPLMGKGVSGRLPGGPLGSRPPIKGPSFKGMLPASGPTAGAPHSAGPSRAAAALQPPARVVPGLDGAADCDGDGDAPGVENVGDVLAGEITGRLGRLGRLSGPPANPANGDPRGLPAAQLAPPAATAGGPGVPSPAGVTVLSPAAATNGTHSASADAVAAMTAAMGAATVSGGVGDGMQPTSTGASAFADTTATLSPPAVLSPGAVAAPAGSAGGMESASDGGAVASSLGWGMPRVDSLDDVVAALSAQLQNSLLPGEVATGGLSDAGAGAPSGASGGSSSGDGFPPPPPSRRLVRSRYVDFSHLGTFLQV